MKHSRRALLKSSIITAIGLAIKPSFVKGSALIAEKKATNLNQLSIRQLSDLIHKKEVSSFEVVSAFVNRIEEVNPSLNAVVAFRPKEALKEATKADIALSKGNDSGILHGIPCTIKDSFDTEGIISTAGTLGRANFIPNKDATVVHRIKNEGAIIMGKTNTPEFTMSFFTDNLVYGKTYNPYDLTRSPGGSSGGAAAIIAAGGSPFDIGTDTGGSIRFPAHCCGIVGLKPTAGRVPRTGHIVDYAGLSQSLTQVGPLAKTVEDLDLLYQIIAGVDNIDPYVYPVPKLDFKKVDFKKLRAAFYIDNGVVKPSADTYNVIQKAISIISKAGIAVKQEAAPGIKNQLEIVDDLNIPVGFLTSGGGLKRLLDKSGTTKTTLSWLSELKIPTSNELAKLQERVDVMRSEMLAFWKNNDVLICPVSPMPAPLWTNETLLNQDYFSYTSLYNTLGWPSIVVRGGTSSEGLPIGIQIIAPPWREDICLSMAKFLETALGDFGNEIIVRKYKA